MSRVVVLVALASLSSACGSGAGAPSAPSAPVVTSRQVLTVVSGDTGQPVAGAMVQASGQRQVTNSAGELTLDPLTNRNLAIEAPGYLRREMVLRDGHGSRLTLWPVDPARGLSAAYTLAIVYSRNLGLIRIAPEITHVTIVPSEEFRSDPLGLASHEHAAVRLTEALDGRITFTVAERAAEGFVVTTGFDDQPCGQTVYPGCATPFVRPIAEITGGNVALTRTFPRQGWHTVILHELGHILGLWHNDDGDLRDLMPNEGLLFAVRDFSPRERTTLRMMYQRRADNRYPDHESDARAPTAMRVSARPVYCALGR